MGIKEKSFRSNINNINAFFSDFNTLWENIDGMNEINDIDNKIKIVLDQRR